jgi:hypothetical protein
MKMNRYYYLSIWPAAVVSMLLVVGLYSADSVDYKSEWMTAHALMPIIVLASIFQTLLIAILNLSIFTIPHFIKQHNSILKIAIWFAPTYIVLSIQTYLMHIKWDLSYDMWMEVSFVLPYAIGTIYSYILFKKTLK